MRLRLQTTADDLGPAGKDIEFGFGIVNAFAAVPPPPTNLPPVVNISSPTDGGTFASVDNIVFAGTAVDLEDGDIAGNLSWSSSVQGVIGAGAGFSRALQPGQHTITASVTDSGGLGDSASVAITVTLAPPPPPPPPGEAPIEIVPFSPDNLTIDRGTLLSGGVGSLQADDGDRLRIRSVRRSGRWITEWSGSVHLDRDPLNLLELALSYDGRNDTAVTQELLLFNFATGSYETVDVREVGGADVAVAFGTGDFGPFIAADGEVRLRVRASHSFIRFESQGDFMQFLITEGGGPLADFFPSTLQHEQGQVIGGGPASLFSDDQVYVHVAPVRRDGSWRVNWQGTAVVTKPVAQIVGIGVTYDGGYTNGLANQETFVFNFETQGWELIDSRRRVAADQTVDWATGAFQPYLSAGGEVRIKVVAEGALRYTALADLMRVRVQLFPPDIEVAPNSFEETVVQGNSVSSTMNIENVGFSDLEFEIFDREATPPLPTPLDSSGDVKGATDSTGPGVLGAGGPDVFGYMWTDSRESGGPTFDWEEISGSGTLLTTASSCDDCSQNVPLGFTFNFYGVDYTNVNVDSNGYLTFTGGTDFSNNPIPDTSSPNAVVAPFWDDLRPSGGGSVYYQTLGSPGNRKLIVEYDGVNRFSGPSVLTFQAILEETTNNISFQYLSMSGVEFAGGSATIGIENADGSDGLQVSLNSVFTENNLAVFISTGALPSGLLTVTPESGAVQPGGVQAISITADSGDLEVGTIEREIVIDSNDPDEERVLALYTLHVVAPAPGVGAGPDQVANEGSVVQLNATTTDTGFPGTHTATVDWGDGTVDAGVVSASVTGAGAVTGSHVYADNATYTITVTVERVNGPAGSLSGSDTLQVTVANVLPTVNAGVDQAVNVGDTVSLDPATFSDPGFGCPTCIPATAENFTATIDWGDGATSTGAVTEFPGSRAVTATIGIVSGSHTYIGPDIYTVTVCVSDDDGGQGCSTLQVGVTVPVPTIGVDVSTGPVFTAVTVTGTNFAANETNIFVTFDGAPAATSPSPITADGNGGWTATFTIELLTLAGAHAIDAFGDTTLATSVADITFTVTTVVPSVSVDAGPDLAVVEGDEFTVRASVTADVAATGLTPVQIEWGDGASGGGTDGGVGASGSGALSVSHSYAEDGNYTVSICATDSAGLVACDEAQVAVANAAPSVDAVAVSSGIEGQAISISATFTDPGTTDTHTFSVDWGDGSSTEGPGQVSAAHRYVDDGTYAVTVCVTDDDGATGCASTTISIVNAAPSVQAGLDLSADEGVTIALSATITDQGAADTHTAIVEWGDGTSDLAAVDQHSGVVTASHAYAENGSYMATVCAQDNAGAVGCD